MSQNKDVSLLRRAARVVFRQKKYLEHKARIREVYFGIRIRILGMLSLVMILVISVLTFIMFINQKNLLKEEKMIKARTLTRILSGPAEFYLDKNVETSKEALSIKLETIQRECSNFKSYNSDIVKIVLTDDRGRIKYSTVKKDYRRKKVLPYIQKALKEMDEKPGSREYTIKKYNKKTKENIEMLRRAITYPIFLHKGNVVDLLKDFNRLYGEYNSAGTKRKRQIYRYLWKKYAETLGEDFSPAKYEKPENGVLKVQKANDIDFLFLHLFNNIMKYRMKYIPKKERWLWNDRWLFTQKRYKFQSYLDDNADKAKKSHDLIVKRMTQLSKKVEKIRRLGTLAVVFDVNAQQKAAEKNIKKVIKIALIMMAISAVAILIVLNFMIQNLKRLEKWAIAVGDGNLDTKIKISTNDEIGRLSDITNYMIGEIKEKFHLEKYVSTSTKNMIQEKKELQTSPNLGVTGRNTYAFIFSDVRGFTSFSEKNDPATVIEVLNFYLELQSEIIKSNNGDINDYVGDEIMAHFSGNKRVNQALDSAVKIMKEIKKANEKRKKAGHPVFEVGIGVHGGDVVVGNIGSKFRMDFACVGDAVNLTSRLCSTAGPGEILVSKELFSLTGKTYTTKRSPSIEVKGKEKKIPIVKIEY
ncbi:MAG: adenylate/guanylate cyclase domain-containing protein [bacterium]|nr:adenylate/guanylate cyclase domain-containing protein [bacterium]